MFLGGEPPSARSCLSVSPPPLPLLLLLLRLLCSLSPEDRMEPGGPGFLPAFFNVPPVKRKKKATHQVTLTVSDSINGKKLPSSCVLFIAVSNCTYRLYRMFSFFT